ncbi:MAG: hypothetical protein EAZ19_27725 [Oscillatoriales cyanobacterium]|nr:MAG: hypothetical protein EAZ94_27180 [Oscillatoriales cyanobacterium]TAE19191.1 MAG: hypothetical protein EAZ93_27525 [Oscillatoriales cyanobacterium]TAG87059.1 MAG: hypothetical protein EAZ19_27725 [Oscillatoriales cyanobacterium]
MIRERWVFFHASGDARTVGFPAIFANFDPRAMGIFPRERGRSHCRISGDFCQFFHAVPGTQSNLQLNEVNQCH